MSWADPFTNSKINHLPYFLSDFLFIFQSSSLFRFFCLKLPFFFFFLYFSFETTFLFFIFGTFRYIPDFLLTLIKLFNKK